jgi:hypothetical protein
VENVWGGEGEGVNKIVNDESLVENLNNMIKYENIEGHPANSYYKSSMYGKQQPIKPLMGQYSL